MNQTQLDGITKARILSSLARLQAREQPFADDAAYIAFVCESAGLSELPDSAADSYAAQHADKTIAGLEQQLADAIIAAEDAENPPAEPLPTPTVGGVPQRVTRRQAKTLMELTPHPAGNLWLAALAAAEAIPDAQTRIVTVNYLLESLNFEYPTVLTMAQSLFGMTSAQVDAMFIAAAKL